MVRYTKHIATTFLQRTIDPEPDDDDFDPSARNALLKKLVFGNCCVAYVPAQWVWVCNPNGCGSAAVSER